MSTDKKKTVVAGALGECVHVAGVTNFLRLAESAGWRTVFLGPSVPIDEVIKVAKREKADMVGVSYRLTPETGERLLGEFAEAASELHEKGVRFAFGGTPPVAERVERIGFFERVFDGSEPSEAILAFMKGKQDGAAKEADFPQSTIERIKWKSPYPILRHHFGLPTMEDTIAGIEKIADAQALDVISLGTDQDAQENFFHPERQDPRRKARGGCPSVRRMITAPCIRRAGAETSRCCERIQAPMISSDSLRCMWIRSTSPGAPSRCSGSTRWMGADRGIWRVRSVSIKA
jgi:methylmalonyl-CoA mutase cobalamin-binding subunit